MIGLITRPAVCRVPDLFVFSKGWEWSGGAKVSFILRRRGVQLILAYSWARPAILVADKGRGGFIFIFY